MAFKFNPVTASFDLVGAYTNPGIGAATESFGASNTIGTGADDTVFGSNNSLVYFGHRNANDL